MPLDQAATNALSPDAKAGWMRQYQTQKRRCDEENGVLRNIVKRAKADGMPIKPMIAAVAASKLDPDEVIRELRDTVELMTIKRIPIAREDLFNWDVELTDKTRAEDDLWDAEDAGYRAGRGGNTLGDCPYPPGSELHVGWTREWHTGEAAIGRELGGNAKPASASKQRPRRARQVDLPLSDAPPAPAKPVRAKRPRKSGASPSRRRAARRAPEVSNNPTVY